MRRWPGRAETGTRDAGTPPPIRGCPRNCRRRDRSPMPLRRGARRRDRRRRHRPPSRREPGDRPAQSCLARAGRGAPAQRTQDAPDMAHASVMRARRKPVVRPQGRAAKRDRATEGAPDEAPDPRPVHPCAACPGSCAATRNPARPGGDRDARAHAGRAHPGRHHGDRPPRYRGTRLRDPGRCALGRAGLPPGAIGRTGPAGLGLPPRHQFPPCAGAARRRAAERFLGAERRLQLRQRAAGRCRAE